MARTQRTPLLGHRDFRLLWAGESLSQGCLMVGHTVLPLIAVQALAVGAFDMGLLAAAETLAFLLVGLPAGVWIDRMRRRSVLIWAAAVRALLVLSVPLVWWTGWLTFGQLLVVAFLGGLCTVFFDVAYQSFLPTVLDRERLVEGNAALQSSQSVAQLAGPPLGGVLAHLLGPVNAALAVAASYFGSSWALTRIAAREGQPTKPATTALHREIAEGVRFLWRERTLRAIALATITCNFFAGVQLAVIMVFLARTIGLSPAVIGIMFASGGLGGILAAVTAPRWTARHGQERTIWLCLVTTFPLGLFIPLADTGPVLLLSILGYAVVGYGAVIFNITQVTHRQTVCPDSILARVNATMRFLTWGVIPLGALLGGALGGEVGIRETMWLASVGILTGPVFLMLSPLRSTAGARANSTAV